MGRGRCRLSGDLSITELLDWTQFILAPQVINGLSLGVAVILMALGLTIIFGLLDDINMAHGEFYALGAYVGVALVGSGLDFWLVLLLVPMLMAPLGYATERLLIQRVFHSKDRHILTQLLADAGYGVDQAFRQRLTELGLPYVVGIKSSVVVWPPGLEPLPPKRYGGRGRLPVVPRRTSTRQPVSVKDLAHALPANAFQTISWRQGTNEMLSCALPPSGCATAGGKHRQAACTPSSGC